MTLSEMLTKISEKTGTLDEVNVIVQSCDETFDIVDFTVKDQTLVIGVALAE